jgi:hypothetical protein
MVIIRVGVVAVYFNRIKANDNDDDDDDDRNNNSVLKVGGCT